ncbi:MAG TPA: hypothetical protein PK453_22455, partial [Leptospiraceae bacterium]|nr:hypothetical protein [Leptospiraceae bacterium]
FKVFIFENGESKTDKIIEKKNISDYQMDYYLNEISLAVLNPSYRINDAAAPMRAEHHITLNSFTLSQSDLEIKKIDLNYSDDRAKLFTETYKSILEEADTLYAKKDFLNAERKYVSILVSLYGNTSTDTQKILRDFSEGIQERIIKCNNNLLYTKFNSDIIHEIQRKFQSSELFKYEDVRKKYRTFLYDAYSYGILEKLNEHSRKGDRLVDKGYYSKAIKEFDYILKIKDKNYLISNGKCCGNSWAENWTIFGEIIDYRKNPEIQNFFSKFQTKAEKIKKNIGILSANRLFARCDVIERSSAYFDVLHSNRQTDSLEAYDAVLAFKKSYDLLKSEDFPEMSADAQKRYTDVLRLAAESKSNSYSENFIRWSEERKTKRENEAEFKSELSTNIPLDIALFPFKYLFNVTVSIFDIFKITPAFGLGAGADTPILHPGIGAASPIIEIKSAQRQPHDRSRDFIWGALLVQHNECLAPLIDFYPIDYSYRFRETCQSKNGWNSAFKLNVWGAAIIGMHLEVDLSRTVNFVPEVLGMNMKGRQFFWDISDTSQSPRFDYFYRSLPIQKRLDWKLFSEIEEPNRKVKSLQAIRQCNSVNMEVASDEEKGKILEIEKVDENSLICVKER